MTKKVFLALVVVMSLLSGVFISRAVQADTMATVPGSQDDPLVTKSYVAQLETQIANLQTQVTTLQSSVTALQQKVTALESKAPGSGGTIASQTATLIANKGYFRAGPATTHKILDTLNKGTTMKVLSKSGEWYRVQLANGQIGWIWFKVVSVK